MTPVVQPVWQPAIDGFFTQEQGSKSVRDNFHQLSGSESLPCARRFLCRLGRELYRFIPRILVYKLRTLRGKILVDIDEFPLL